MADRVQGTVKWFNSDKAYGFITVSDYPDLFVHYSEIQDSGYQSLSVGDLVELEIVNGARGLQASAVTRVDS
jgi:CspA family cold shock protein